MMQTNIGEMYCLVCAEPGAGKHYGSLCCSGCKGFFRRSIRTKRNYACSYHDDCLIRKEYRNCCRSCRMNKCIAVGMNPKLVHSDRGTMARNPTSQFERQKSNKNFCHDSPDLPTDFSHTIAQADSSTATFLIGKSSPDLDYPSQSSTTTILPYIGGSSNALVSSGAFSLRNNQQWQAQRDALLFINSSATMLEDNQLPLGTKSWIPMFQHNNIDSVIQYYMSVDQMLDRFAEHEHSHVFAPDHLYHVNTNIDLQRALIEPRSMMTRTRIDWSLAYPIHGALTRIWMRVGMYYLDWMSHVPELNRLSLDDRLRLTAGRSMACISALVAQRSAACSEAKGVALSGGVYYPIDESIEKTMDKTIVKFLGNLTHFLWSDVVEQIRRLKITDAEMCILRILCLLSGVPCLSPEGREIIRDAHAYYTNVLFKTVNEIVGCSQDRVATRLCDLMSLLPAFEKVANLQDDCFSMMCVADFNGLGNNLVTDYHLRKTYRV